MDRSQSDIYDFCLIESSNLGLIIKKENDNILLCLDKVEPNIIACFTSVNDLYYFLLGYSFNKNLNTEDK